MTTVRQVLPPLPVPATAAAPRAGLLRRMARAAVRRIQIANLRQDIHSHEQYLARCQRDGLIVSGTVVDWSYALNAKRAQLRELEAS